MSCHPSRAFIAAERLSYWPSLRSTSSTSFLCSSSCYRRGATVRASSHVGETRRRCAPMQELIARADKVARLLKHRGETIAVAESSTGGLIAAALLAVPGASAYFLGGAVVYTELARAALLGIGDAEMQGLRSATETYALLLARRVRDRHAAVWGVGETGATGPTGNRHGDPAGHTCIAIAGPTE